MDCPNCGEDMQLTITLQFCVEDTVDPDEFLDDILVARPDIMHVYQMAPRKADIGDISSNTLVWVPDSNPTV